MSFFNTLNRNNSSIAPSIFLSGNNTTIYNNNNIFFLKFFDPIYYGYVSQNSSTDITLSNITNIGNLLSSNIPYVLESDKGDFLIDTATTKSNNNNIVTLATSSSIGFFIFNSPSLTTNSIKNARCNIRRLLRFIDIWPKSNNPPNLTVSGIVSAGNIGTADNYVYQSTGSLLTIFNRTGIGAGWKDASNTDRNNAPFFISLITKRGSSTTTITINKPLF